MQRAAMTRRNASASVRGSNMLPADPADRVPARPATRAEAAAYIGAIAKDLSSIALAADLPLIAYFLDMAREEAKSAQRQMRRA